MECSSEYTQGPSATEAQLRSTAGFRSGVPRSALNPDPLGLIVRPYRITVQPERLETLESYSRRLLEANFDEPVHERYLLNLARAANPDAPALWTKVIEAKGRLVSGHFGRVALAGPSHSDGSTCRHCTAGLESRFMCRDCANGSSVQEYPHLTGNICLTHRRWIGPGTLPTEQTLVDSSHVQAEHQYLRLCRRGLLTAPFYLELREMLRVWQRTENTTTLSVSRLDCEIYPAMMSLAATLTNWNFMRSFFDPCRTFAEAYDRLIAAVRHTIPGDTDNLCRSLWLYFRPVFLSIRDNILNASTYRPAWEHDFPIPPHLIAEFGVPIRPLAPFRRYLEASGDHVLTDGNWRAVLIHVPRQGTIRNDVHPSSAEQSLAICRCGHRFLLRTHGLRKALRRGSDGCLYCANRAVLDGHNDLRTCFPYLALQLHPTRNGEITGENILAGSSDKLWWLCPVGDEYESRVSSRTRKGSGCPYCSGARARTGINDLGTMRPDLAYEWHPHRNSRGPDTVTVGSGYRAWWYCLLQHSYQSTVLSRTNGKGCPKCSGRVATPRVNDILTRRPDLAKEWDTEANGPLTPDQVTVFSHTPVVWRCEQLHTYRKSPAGRVRRGGCPFCSRRQLLEGFNDLRTVQPLLSGEWHDSNSPSDPSEVLPDGKKHHWRCAQGHLNSQTLANRIRSRGCPQCPPAMRILATEPPRHAGN